MLVRACRVCLGRGSGFGRRGRWLGLGCGGGLLAVAIVTRQC